jgi:hypothetical protein
MRPKDTKDRDLGNFDNSPNFNWRSIFLFVAYTSVVLGFFLFSRNEKERESAIQNRETRSASAVRSACGKCIEEWPSESEEVGLAFWIRKHRSDQIAGDWGSRVGFFSSWEIQQEIATGLVRQINIPGLRIPQMFSWALPSGELGGLPGEFYKFANSIRSELSAVSVRPLKELA